MINQTKRRRCKECGELFTPFSSLSQVCSTACAVAFAQKDKGKVFAAKSRRRENAKAKKNLKTQAQWAKEAQAAFNKYIRARDIGKPCVSCDKPDSGSHQRHASHYRSVGACSSLRFNTKNVYASCSTCNNHLSGNLIEYRIRLNNRYGKELTDWLETQNGIRRYDIDYLKRIKRIFTKKAKLILDK